MVRSAFLMAAFLAATGCSAVVSGSSEEADAQSTSVTGVVVVDRTVSDESSHGEASARFVRLRGAIDNGALRLVGAGLDLPPVGECSAVRDGTSSRSVELLDVGAISIESESGQRVALAQRQVPDVVDLVSGSVYSARIDETTVPSGADVAVLVGGSTDVPAFSVRAKTPEAPSAVRLALDGSGGDLRWNAGGDRSRDAIYVDVGGTRCSFADDGHAVIPASALGEEGSLSVHRVRREKLSIPGLDGGEVRFDFARTIAYRR